jgi:hypothetical protein
MTNQEMLEALDDIIAKATALKVHVLTPQAPTPPPPPPQPLSGGGPGEER